jgi:hypothetical protein
MSWLRHLARQWGLALARWGGWTPPRCPRRHAPDLDPALLADVAACVAAVDALHRATASGAFRHRETLRMLQNRHPAARDRDLNYAIEMAIQAT